MLVSSNGVGRFSPERATVLKEGMAAKDGQEDSRTQPAHTSNNVKDAKKPKVNCSVIS
ncbi:hypothetical protein J26TS2_26830 [Shouchella clausii]|nr:hypothetical protein J26TS2_26830 [Shouchella clausii]